MLSVFLGAVWLWNAAAYHAFLFTRINPAAWIFSALFAVQAVLFLRAGQRRVQTDYVLLAGGVLLLVALVLRSSIGR